jgi:peptidoglycan L-alanyl-D-glutamate endopeptidase CwlK
MINLDPSSLSKLVGVHPDLIKVVHRVAELSTIPFCVVYGVRTIAEEIEAIDSGHSSLSDPTKCRHVPTGHPPYGHAVDIALWLNGRPSFHDNAQMTTFIKIGQLFQQVGVELKVPGGIRSGFMWKTFKDWGHHELTAWAYP